MAASSAVVSAIIPAAGFGTRLLPITRAIPKEMLPIGRLPVLEHVVLELKAAGIERILIVVSPKKEMIREYFGDGSAWGVEIAYALQPEMRGLGDALLHGEEWVSGQPVVVAFGDALIQPGDGAATRRLIEAFHLSGDRVSVLVEPIDPSLTHRYGMVVPHMQEPPHHPPCGREGRGVRGEGDLVPISTIIEKPKPENAPSNLAVAARYCISAELFSHLRYLAGQATGELGLTEAACQMMSENAPGMAVLTQPGERRCDIGGWDSYLLAAAQGAITDSEFGEQIKQNLLG